MAIALLSLRQAEKVEPQLRAALKGQPAMAKPTASDLAQAGLSARECLALRDGSPAEQPVYLTADDTNPNGATVRFLVDGAEIVEHAGYERIVYMFDGHDAGAVEHARAQWKAAKAAGCEATYWQQSPEGRWEKKA